MRCTLTTPLDADRQDGFSLVSAIFILLTLAALGAVIATVSTLQHVGSALDVVGVRAYYAARAGSEWGAARIAGTAGSAFCAANPVTTFILVSGVSSTVRCSTVVTGGAVEAGLGSIYLMTSTACTHPVAGDCPGTAEAPSYVERRLTSLVEFPPD